MAELRILIVDDEPLARRGIRQMLAGEADVVVVGECRNGREAVEALHRLNPDLVFLDVQMPDLDGFAVIREHGIERMPAVVFVTAHDEFAVHAFEAHALDYLVKPLHAARFAQTMARVRERQRVGSAMELVSQLSALLGAGNPTATTAHLSGAGRRYDTRLVVPATTGDRIVDVDTIDWVEADDYYARLHVGRVQYLLRESLSRLARRLDPAAFARVHRSAIVRIDGVREIQGSRGRTVVVLRDGTRIRVSRRRTASLRALVRRCVD
jgi:two-component system LytT family response regulator